MSKAGRQSVSKAGRQSVSKAGGAVSKGARQAGRQSVSEQGRLGNKSVSQAGRQGRKSVSKAAREAAGGYAVIQPAARQPTSLSLPHPPSLSLTNSLTH